jgi:hypothetical protein
MIILSTLRAVLGSIYARASATVTIADAYFTDADLEFAVSAQDREFVVDRQDREFLVAAQDREFLA